MPARVVFETAGGSQTGGVTTTCRSWNVMSHPVTDVGVGEGKGSPLGATCRADGVNFSVYSRNGAAVELLLFDRPDDPRPSRTIPLDPARNRTYYYWHVFVPGLRAGQLYGYRVSGPDAPERGLRFDPGKIHRCARTR